MKKIKVLLTGMSSNLGGIETYLYNLYRFADKDKFEFSFLTFDYGQPVCFETELTQAGAKFYKVTPRTKNYSKFKADLKKVYSQEQFDYIHFNLMDFSCFERITYAKKYSRAKLVVHSHCGNAEYLKNNHLRTTLLNTLGKFKTRNIPYLRVACGKQAGDYMFGGKPYKIFNNGIDIDKFKFNINNRKEIRTELNLTEDTTVYGLVAAFLPVKNHTFLIDVFNEILKSNPNSQLLLIGEGPLQKEIQNQVKTLNLEDKVIFLGKRTDTFKIYSALDLYVMPSLAEGLSISLVEAQVNGLKCYTSRGVDPASNLTGNVSFISLDEKVQEWAKVITSNNNQRDKEVLTKIPDKFKAQNSYQEVYKFYRENLK